VDYNYLKKIKNFQKKSFQKIVVLSNIFLSIFHYIGLYIYIVKYNSSIKIPGFLWNISKKNFKTFSKRKKYFIVYGQILKNIQAYLHKNKNCIFFIFKKNPKMDIITNLWSSTKVWPKYKKSFPIFFLGSRCRL
jgi:hypothetical protein